MAPPLDFPYADSMSSFSTATPLPPESETDPNAVEQAWAETVERRMREVRQGKVRTASSKDVFAALDAIVDPR